MPHKGNYKAMNGTPDPYNPETEPDPVEVWIRFWGFIIDPKHTSAVAAIATLALCVTTILYTIFSALQWSANEKAAVAAKSAAETAENTLKQSVKAYKIDERAWVSIFDVEPKNQGTFTINIVLVNTGKTPARNFIIAAAGDVGEGRSNENKLPGRGIIAPGGKFSSYMQANGSLTSSTKVTIHGRVDYDTVFGASHWTKFCYYLIPQKAGNPGGFAPCESGNEIDDNPEP